MRLEDKMGIESVEYSQVNILQPEDIVTYKQYKLDRHEKLKLTHLYENVRLSAVIPAGTKLDRSELEVYVGANKTEQEYLSLSESSFTRLVLRYDDETIQKVQYYLIELNPYFMETGQQELFRIQKEETINNSQLLGFSSYNTGGFQ